jgi:hypothetical protein
MAMAAEASEWLVAVVHVQPEMDAQEFRTEKAAIKVVSTGASQLILEHLVVGVPAISDRPSRSSPA